MTEGSISLPAKAIMAANADASAPLFNLRADELRDQMRGRLQRDEFVIKREPGAAAPAPPMLGPFGMWPVNEQVSFWQVYIRHSAGSLDAAVASVRRRNLFVSFGILALLAASVALLLVSIQRARRLAQQQMDFVAGVSHELRTPLAVIDSAAYNLDKGVVKELHQIKDYGALIRKETARLKEMIEQVIEFASVQSGRQRYDLQPTQVEHVITEVLASFQPLLARGGFYVESDVAADLPPVIADPAALARAIQNLLNNAMKYGGESRRIGLRARSITIGHNSMVQIVVIDRGLGIPAEELSQIFEPFYRGNEVRAAQIRGNGLGLSLVKNIVTAHRGTIKVESAPGAGSSFFIVLPALGSALQHNAQLSHARNELSA